MLMKFFTKTNNADINFYKDYKVRFYFVCTKNKILYIYRDNSLN